MLKDLSFEVGSFSSEDNDSVIRQRNQSESSAATPESVRKITVLNDMNVYFPRRLRLKRRPEPIDVENEFST